MSTETLTRGLNAFVGAIAGLSFWCIFEILPDVIASQAVYLWITCAICGFFTVFLGLAGPLAPRASATVAAALGLSAASLLFWSSFRYPGIDSFFNTGQELAAFVVVICIGAPFGAALISHRFLDYTYLFDTAWGIVVRYVAAGVFVGIFWAALFLSDALLNIVGITLIWDLVEMDGVWPVLSGAVLGLALTVAYELRDYVSPFLPLRLLRLLLPPLALVVAVFLLALPFKGVSDLFGDYSAAATLITVALVAITLVSAAIDSTEQSAIGTTMMRYVTGGMSGMLPLLAALSVWSIWLRVADYGWTPDRLAAFTLALVMLGYGGLYASTLWRADWMARLRKANVFMALAVLGISALWMTPILDAMRISANSQVTRFLDGRSTLSQLPVWELKFDWGKAGERAIARLQAQDSKEYPDLHDHLKSALRDGSISFQDTQEKRLTQLELAQSILTVAQLRPETASISATELADLPRHRLVNFNDSCRAQSCVLLAAPLGPQNSQELWLLFDAGATINAVGYMRGEGGTFEELANIWGFDRSDYDAIRAGAFEIAPSKRKAIWVEGRELMLR